METKMITRLGMLLAVSLILSYIESLIPVIISVPGIKLGLANIITMYVLYVYKQKTAFVIMLMRVLISGILFTGLNTVIFGLLGGIFCIISMTIAVRLKKFSIMGVSVSGAVFHNLGQILAAFIIMDNVNILYYFPFLMISGIITGFIIGYISAVVIKRFQNM